MKTIKLTRGMVAIVDDQDFEFVSRWSWFAAKRKNTFYAARTIPSGKKRPLGVAYMHREILEAPPGVKTDHGDGDGLNNTRENIRICTAMENARGFRVLRRTKTVRFRGVTPRRNKFRARITVNKIEIPIGVFDDQESAAKAYDLAALRHFGEFASVNFPKTNQPRASK